MKALLLLLGILAVTEGYRILVIYTFPVRSLNNLGEGIVRHLLNAGHENIKSGRRGTKLAEPTVARTGSQVEVANWKPLGHCRFVGRPARKWTYIKVREFSDGMETKVTYITCYPRKLNNPKLREIDVSENVEVLANDDHMNISYILNSEVELSSDVTYIQDMCMDIAVKTFENKNVRSFLDDPKEKFDVVISDYVETEIYAAFAELYKCPMIWSYSMGAHWIPMRLLDDPTNPAYSTDYITTIAPPFSFSERFQVLWGQIRWRYAKFFNLLPKEKEAYNKFFTPAFVRRGGTLPDYEDIIYNSSLILSNEHLATGAIPKTPQNWKLVGGFHIEDPPKPLPKDLQDIMDNAKHGVIFFSMGSVWKSEMVPKEITEGLLKMFGQLKSSVIWKYEGNLKNVPKNVHTVKWAPQQSILAHPNCRLFISHGGLLSSTEAIHFAVPTIGVPISYDQFINIDKAVRKGYAIMVELTYNLAKDLKSAIRVMFDDPKYKQKAKELSSIYHDRPVSSGKELVHWVEYVIRTNGALHLRSPALEAPFYQKAYLDIIGLLFAPLVTALALKSLFSGGKKVGKEKRS